MNSKVSVIVPMFNAERYLQVFVNYILKQTYANWELILVDDGSTDNTVNLANQVSKQDNRILVIQRDRLPKGSVVCRNIGQLRSSGQYIIHFDVDDIVNPFCLEQRVSYMEKHSDVDYSSFRGATVSFVNGEYKETGRYWGIDNKKDLLSSFLEADYPFSVWNNIYKSCVFKNILWDEKVKIYTDFSYIIPTILSGFRHSFAENSSTDYYYVVNNSNAMTSNFISNEKYNSTKYLFDKTYNNIAILTNRKKYYKAFKNYYYLQYERILVSGDYEQINDFIEYYKRYYKDEWRLKICFFILKKSIKNKRNTTRKVRFVMYCVCRRKEFFAWIKHRIWR